MEDKYEGKILFNKDSRLVTITEDALEKYGHNLKDYLDIIKEKTGNWKHVNIMFPSSIAVDPEVLSQIDKLTAVRVFESEDRKDTTFTRPLEKGELLRNKAGHPIVFSGFRMGKDIVIEDEKKRVPFTNKYEFRTIADTDIDRVSETGATKKDGIYNEFNKLWKKDNTSVLVDNFRNSRGDIDVSQYLSQLSDNEAIRLARNLERNVKDVEKSPTSTIKFVDNKNAVNAEAKKNLAEQCRTYIAQCSRESTSGNRINEYIFKHLCVDSYFNNDKFGILKEDHDRRTLTLDTEVVSGRTLNYAINKNLEGAEYIKDNLKFENKDGGPQSIILDMLEEQRAKERDWAEKNKDNPNAVPPRKFILRSVEMNSEINTMLGEKQENEIKKVLEERDKRLKGGLSTSEKDIQALIDLKNKELFDGCTNLTKASFNCPVVPKHIFHDNEYLDETHFGEKVEVVDDFSFKNCTLKVVGGGENVRIYGNQTFAQTTKADDFDFHAPKDSKEYREYFETPFREDRKKHGHLKTTQEAGYKGIAFLKTGSFLNVEETGTAAFLNSKLKVGTLLHHEKETVNRVLLSEKAKKIGACSFMNTDIEGFGASTINDHLRFEHYALAGNKDLEYLCNGKTRDGSNGVDYGDGVCQGAGQSGIKKESRSLKTEGKDHLEIRKGDKCQRRAFFCANVKKLAIMGAAAGNIAKNAFAGCFQIRSITFLESVGTLLITPFQLAGAIGSLLYRHTLKPYVDRTLARWLKGDPKTFYSTVDKLGRDIPSDDEEMKKEKEDTVKEIEELASKGTDLVPSKDKSPSLKEEANVPDLADKDLTKESDSMKQFKWMLFIELYKMAMQKGLSVDEFLDTLKPSIEKDDLVEITDYTEITNVDAKETIDPENPQRKYPKEVFDHLQFRKKENGVVAPVLALPESINDETLSGGERSNMHITGYDNDGNKASVVLLSSIPAELDAMRDMDSDKLITLSLSDKEFKDFYLSRTGVDVTNENTPDRDIQKVYDSLNGIAVDEYNKYMGIAKKCTCEYLYKKEALENTKSANEIYQKGVKKLFTKSMLEQIAGNAGMRRDMEKAGRSPDSIILSDGTKVDCSWNKVRGKDEFAFSMSTTRPVETGMSKEELLKKYPFVCEKNEALGKCYLYKSHSQYQELVSKHSADMVKPFPGEAGESSLKLRYDKKSDKYSLFMVNKSYSTNVPTTLDAKQLTDFTVYMANDMVSNMAYVGNPAGISPNKTWDGIRKTYEGVPRETVFKVMGITKDKAPAGQSMEKKKSVGREL